MKTLSTFPETEAECHTVKYPLFSQLFSHYSMNQILEEASRHKEKINVCL